MNPIVTIRRHTPVPESELDGPTEDYEAEFENFTGSGSYGQFVLRHSFCEGVSLRMTIYTTPNIGSTWASLSLEEHEIDATIDALNECKRRLIESGARRVAMYEKLGDHVGEERARRGGGLGP